MQSLWMQLNNHNYARMGADGLAIFGPMLDGHDDVGMQVSMAGDFALKFILMVKTDPSIWDIKPQISY